MNLPLFLSRKIYNDQGDRHKVSRPVIHIATIGVAIGLAVMIVTVSVVLGFKHTIRDKVVGFGSHIQVTNVQSAEQPVCLEDSMMQALQETPGIRHAARFATAQGILKTDDDFLGVILKGIGPEYDTTFLNDCIVEGEMPQFGDSAVQYPLVISKTMSDKLSVHAGDRIFAYFINEDGVRTRRFNICGVYATNMKRYDDALCITDLRVAQKLNGWRSDQCSGAELLVEDFSQLAADKQEVTATIRNHADEDGNHMAPATITESYPQVFSWLELLDINVWIILSLMVVVAGFTMASGLLIIILERTQMIGILKALGARNATIRHTFLWFATFIIARGLLWGNLIGIGIVLLQMYTGVVTLDPKTYYVSQAPMELHIPIIILLNIATLLACILVLVIPSFLVERIHPARSMRYE